jgi:hypothetical protein
VGRARLAVVEPALFEQTCFKWQRRYKVPPNVRCVVICFLNAKGECPAEIHKQTVYGDVMNWQNVTKCCRELSEGRTDIHDEKGVLGHV